MKIRITKDEQKFSKIIESILVYTGDDAIDIKVHFHDNASIPDIESMFATYGIIENMNYIFVCMDTFGELEFVVDAENEKENELIDSTNHKWFYDSSDKVISLRYRRKIETVLCDHWECLKSKLKGS